MAFASIFFGKKTAIDETVWHRCRTPFIPKRTIDGDTTFGMGQVWRRRTADGWEYQKDPEDPDDWAQRNAW